jgi:hypothetical protein
MTTLPPSCADYLEILGPPTSWIPKCLYRPVTRNLRLVHSVITLKALIVTVTAATKSYSYILVPACPIIEHGGGCQDIRVNLYRHILRIVLSHNYVHFGRNTYNEWKPCQSLHWPEAPEVDFCKMLEKLQKYMNNVTIRININTRDFKLQWLYTQYYL